METIYDLGTKMIESLTKEKVQAGLVYIKLLFFILYSAFLGNIRYYLFFFSVGSTANKLLLLSPEVKKGLSSPHCISPQLRKDENVVLLLAILENTIMLFVCPPKFCISIVFVFSWDHCNSQEKLETMLCKILGDKQRVLWYFPDGPVVLVFFQWLIAGY